MKLKVFIIYDNKKERCLNSISEASCGLMIRNNAQVFKQINPYFLDDFSILEVGEFDESSKSFMALPSPVPHDWDEWKQPETSVKPLTEEQKKDFKK